MTVSGACSFKTLAAKSVNARMHKKFVAYIKEAGKMTPAPAYSISKPFLQKLKPPSAVRADIFGLAGHSPKPVQMPWHGSIMNVPPSSRQRFTANSRPSI